jgi:hypothetical protein
MATNMPAIPGREMNQPNMGMADVVGIPQNEPAPDTGGSQDQEQIQLMSRIREIHSSIETLSRQYPDSAKGARKAKEGLVEMMTAIVSSQKNQEPMAPRVVG